MIKNIFKAVLKVVEVSFGLTNQVMPNKLLEALVFAGLKVLVSSNSTFFSPEIQKLYIQQSSKTQIEKEKLIAKL